MALKLSPQVLNKRVFREDILSLHIKEFMLGQTSKYLKKDKITIDVGAATGMYSSYFAIQSKQVHSFEAVEPVYNQLIKIKEKHKNVITYNKAVSDKVGTFSFFVDDKRLSNSSFQNLLGGQEIQVESVTLDSMNFQDVGFIKIDVEGCELDVLNGAVKTIDKYKPTCMVEVYEKFNKYPIETTFDFFIKRRYKCFYNHRGGELKEIYTLPQMVYIAKTQVEITDGDFLFAYE